MGRRNPDDEDEDYVNGGANVRAINCVVIGRIVGSVDEGLAHPLVSP